MTAAEPKEFFLVILPGLEDLALKELTEWFPTLESKIERGGITVHAPLAVGLSMNSVLKIPTRILVRVTQFSCRDFPKLFKTLAEFQWSDWIQPFCDMKIHAAAGGSRLKMKKRIEETAAEAWLAYQQKRKARVSKKHPLNLYIRLADNICTVSLDTFGERLHKRGVREHVGEAPLRETIAAALIQMMSEGSTGNIELVDPMMGSGTFLIEASGLDQAVDQRAFAESCFRMAPAQAPTRTAPRPYFEKLVGFEQDKKTLAAAKHNLKGLSQKVEVHHQDFLQAEPLAGSSNRWVICNPPYGERLKVEEPLSQYYAKLFVKTELVCKPQQACFLLPAKGTERLNFPATWKIKEKRRFSNGGIPVIAYLLERKD